MLGPQEMVGPLANQVAVMVVPGDFLQNGGINGNGIRVRRQNFDGSSTVVDAVSYEAAIPGSNEGDSHVGFDDQFGESAMSFARCPDGTDTEVNDADFAGVAPTPGLENDCLGGE